MLSPHEFIIGTFANAAPLSLILPRSKYEDAALIGSVEGVPAAVILTGQFAFHYFESTGNDNWRGLIVPDVHIEVDEGTLFDPNQHDVPLGTIIRIDTRLVITAKRENSFGRGSAVTLYQDLPPAEELKAGFGGWQVVIGEGPLKRTLWRVPAGDITSQSTV